MFRRKSYSDEDVYLTAIRWREIEEAAEEQVPPIPEGMLKWARASLDNKAKLHKAFGIQHGFILGAFQGDSRDFDRFLRDVLVRAHDHGFMMRFGKGIFKTHRSLINKMDSDYFEGVEEGRRQLETGGNHYLIHRQTYRSL